jgi:hypothetical protein
MEDSLEELNAVHLVVYCDCCVKFLVRCKKFVTAKTDTGMSHNDVGQWRTAYKTVVP